jgi:hypothetical protein
VSSPKPKLGAPIVSIALPFRLRIFVCSSTTLPAASRTPSSDRTRPSRFWETGSAAASEPSKEIPDLWPVTTASVPAYDSTKIASNALSIVSVRT